MLQEGKRGVRAPAGEKSAKSVEATYRLLIQTTRGDERIAELWALWERVKVSLPDKAITYDIANGLGCELQEKGKYGEEKVIKLTALEGRRRLLGAEHKKTLTSLNNTGIVLKNMEDYEGALGYYQQALRVQEKVLGKTHPDTLRTIMNGDAVHGLDEGLHKGRGDVQAGSGWSREIARKVI